MIAPAPRRRIVVGTAGHIDHGKSSLVRALTGIDPDRLAEEKQRGITIDLGFADLDLGDGLGVSFVDVPGHERFVRHMVAGATGIDAVLLVVAADDGVRPQTLEHLAICQLLGIPRGLIVVTKCDLVSPDLIEVVRLELEPLVTATFLSAAPALSVSSRDGMGMDRLLDELRGWCVDIPATSERDLPRLPVDRSFVMRGFGTVVTGTARGGSFEVGSEVEVLPGGRRARIRGLQVHGENVTRSAGRGRIAVNLQGVERQSVPRGSILTTPGAMVTTRRAWARLTLLPDRVDVLSQGGVVRFHQGTCERDAHLRMLAHRGQGAYDGELYFDQETVLAPGDRFVLRRPAPVDTLGGGVIVDARPPHRRRAAERNFAPRALELPEAVAIRLERAGAPGLEATQLSRELAISPGALERLLGDEAETTRPVKAAGRWVARPAWQELARRIGEVLDAAHRNDPARWGPTREELRLLVAPSVSQEVWRELLEQLARQGAVQSDDDRVARCGRRVVLDGSSARLAEQVEAQFREAWLDPPDPKPLMAATDPREAALIVDWLIKEQRLVRIRDGRLFHAEALRWLRERLVEYARQSPTLDVAAFKQLAGVTRKNAIPLLEQLDAERLTRRVGNVREILAAAG